MGSEKTSPEFKTGQDMNSKNNSIKVTLPQLSKDKRIKKILFRYTDCRLKTCFTNNVIYKKFEMIFLDQKLIPIAGFKTVGEFVDLKELKKL